MLRFEAALARAAGDVGLVDAASARVVADACISAQVDVRGSVDLTGLAASVATEATPVVALVGRIRALVPEHARQAVHVAATSQDVVDTATMLVARDATGVVLTTGRAVTDLLAALAAEHRDTPMVGRTLLQHGEPTTFGALAAVRLLGVGEALRRLEEVRATRLAVQLAGAVGTPAAAGPHAVALGAAVAAYLELGPPVVPWHPTRGRVVELAAALGGWQAESATLVDLLRLSAATAEHTRASLDGLVVHPERMRAAVDTLLARTGRTLDVTAAAALVDRAIADGA